MYSNQAVGSHTFTATSPSMSKVTAVKRTPRTSTRLLRGIGLLPAFVELEPGTEAGPDLADEAVQPGFHYAVDPPDRVK
jgi:hypothetical protein